MAYFYTSDSIGQPITYGKPVWQVRYVVTSDDQTNCIVTNGVERYTFQTNEWAQSCADHFNALERIKAPLSGVISGSTISNVTPNAVSFGKDNGVWECYLFGSYGEGITWVPSDDKVPNWFWRKMQFIFFGNRWVKK